MSVRVKLLLALVPLVIALVGIGAVAVGTVSLLGRNSETLLRQNYRSVLAAYRMRAAIERIDRAAAVSLAAGTPLARAALEARRARFEEELDAQRASVFEPAEREPTERIGALWQLYWREIERFAQARDRAAAKRIYSARLVPLLGAIRRQADDLVAVNQRAMAEKSARAREAARRLNAFLVGSVVAAVAIGLPLSLFLVQRVSRRLDLLTRAVERVDAGDFDTRVGLRGGDEIARLASRLDDLAAHLDDYRKSSAGELLQAQRSAQATIDSIPDPVVVFGARGYALNVNRAGELLLGLGSPLRVREPLSSAAPAVRAALERVCDSVLRTGKPDDSRGLAGAIRALTPIGERDFLPRATPVFATADEIVGATVILQDVTALRRFEEVRNDLVATVGHELRTPLTALRMAVHLCLERSAGDLTAKQESLLATARISSDRLQATVDDLLDLARLQSGQLELRRRPTELCDLVRNVLTASEGQTREARARLAVEVPDALPVVNVDPERIRIVFSNLLRNALRHSPPQGQIRICASQEDHALRVSVADQGEGVPEQHRPFIFDKFYRVPGTAEEGAGLGLAIARGIVAAHGGEIGFASESGRGSEFWFTLPCPAA